MNQLTTLFGSLSNKQKVTIGIVAAAVVLAMYGLVRWEKERDFRPLYTELAPEDAGAVLAKIRESGVEYRLAENGATVLVPSARAAELRLQLASDGIPKSGRIGFEIFDKTNFGLSDFTEQVNYHRAIEGELERSVMALSGVEQARVHITFPKDSVFLDSREPAKASVLVKLRPGVRLTPQNVMAIAHLTASAVDGLAPDAVSVLDMRGNLLSRPRPSGPGEGPGASEAGLEYRESVERDLNNKIAATLDPLLGSGKFRSGVSADVDFSSGDQSEETFDPAHSVMVNAQKSEDVSGGNLASGVPGTQSNLPRPTSRPGSTRAGATRRTENIAYQSSRTVKKMHLPQGSIKRLSVSVLVDYGVKWRGAGAKAVRTLEAPSAERLKSIHDLVAAGIGFSAARGDQLVIESLPFDATLNPEILTGAPTAAPPANGLPPWLNDMLKGKNLVMIGAGAGVALLLLAAALAMALRKGGKRPAVTSRAAIGPGAGSQIPSQAIDMQKVMEAKLAEHEAQRDREAIEALGALKLSTGSKKTEVLTRHIAEGAKRDPAVMAHVLRTWLNESKS